MIVGCLVAFRAVYRSTPWKRLPDSWESLQNRNKRYQNPSNSSWRWHAGAELCHPDQQFLVTRIGCGIAGFSPDEIASLFAKAAEVEFVLQMNNEIVPVEVKSENNVKTKSLSIYRKTYSPSLSLRFSTRNIRKDDDLLNLPLYLADRISKIYGMTSTS